MLFDFNKNITLENDRIILRPLIAEDWKLLLPIAIADKTLLLYSPSQIHNEAFLKEYIATALAAKSDKLRFAFLLFDKQKNKYAGCTSFGNISNKNLRIEIGWTWIGKQFQGTGLNRACKFLLLSYAFETLEFERVELKTDARNQQSRRAIEKIGGQFEGTLRSHTLMSDDYRRDTVYYGLLKSEWQSIKKEYFADVL